MKRSKNSIIYSVLASFVAIGSYEYESDFLSYDACVESIQNVSMGGIKLKAIKVIEGDEVTSARILMSDGTMLIEQSCIAMTNEISYTSTIRINEE